MSIFILFLEAELFKQLKVLFVLCSNIFCCLALFQFEVQMTTCSANKPFSTFYLSSFMNALKNVVLNTAPCGRPTFVCLYLKKDSTLINLGFRNLESQDSMFSSMLMPISFPMNLALHAEIYKYCQGAFFSVKCYFYFWRKLTETWIYLYKQILVFYTNAVSLKSPSPGISPVQMLLLQICMNLEHLML